MNGPQIPNQGQAAGAAQAPASTEGSQAEAGQQKAAAPRSEGALHRSAYS